jgi:hypothetical protein
MVCNIQDDWALIFCTRSARTNSNVGLYYFLFIFGAGVEPSSQLLRPFIGLLYQARMTMMIIVDQLVGEWVTGETKVLGENLLQSLSVRDQHNSGQAWTGAVAARCWKLTVWATARPSNILGWGTVHQVGSRVYYRWVHCIGLLSL